MFDLLNYDIMAGLRVIHLCLVTFAGWMINTEIKEWRNQ